MTKISSEEIEKNEDIQCNIHQKDRANREYILSGNMWKVIFTICIPLAIYQSINQIFKVFDAKMAAHISSYAMSAVSYVSQIDFTVSAVGAGLAMGSGIKISQAYGAGEFDLLKKRICNMYLLSFGMAILCTILSFFAHPILSVMNMPQELMSMGVKYFVVDIFSVAIAFINQSYIAIERARGNSKVILYLNLVSVVLKFTLSYFLIYVFDFGITAIAIATLVTQLAILIITIIRNRDSKNLFSFSFKYISKDKNVTPPMVKLSIPVIFEKISFSFGKVIINSMSTGYGVLTVGALGVTNQISGMTNSPQNGFQEGGAAVISQNLGARQYKRAISAFWVILSYNLIISFIGFTISMVFIRQIAYIFAPGEELLASMIVQIYSYEAFGAVSLGISVSVMALLYGYGMTKLTFLMNFCRLFIFRIPVLYALQHYTTIGYEAVGIVMMVSNISVTVMSIIIGFYVTRKVYKEQKKCEDGVINN